MRRVHFLNVNNGDCSIIQHGSGRVTVIDVCNASPTDVYAEAFLKAAAAFEPGKFGHFNQNKYPANPISYMRDRGIISVFRFVLTHPDMDHLDGIEAFFNAFSPGNFWDTDNTCEKEFGLGNNGGYSGRDWNFYKNLRDGISDSDPKRLTLYSGAHGKYWSNDDFSGSGDGIVVLAPTSALVAQANECDDHNDCSYVLLYRAQTSNGGTHKILFAGDSHDATWEHILEQHGDLVSNVDLLIAPHHGRHSDRDWEFLDVLNPSLTLFGNADSEHLAYSAWSNRGLPIITNNQAGNIIVDVDSDPMVVYVTCEKFAKSRNAYSFFSDSVSKRSKFPS
jgi:beta-lactamase superfamily II metal-dependent hydrolase